MIHQPPAGARDLLPLEVAQKIWIEGRLQERFTRWGYHRIITSTLERLDTLMAGGAIQRSTVIQLQDSDEEELGLRPELTASIARAAVTRMAGSSWWPQRLYYNANVFRKGEETGHGTQQEFYQAGVELLGSGGWAADGEILLLLSECLQSVGVKGCHLILGEAHLTARLLDPFPLQVREKVRHSIAHLDRITLEKLPLSQELRDRALLLFDLRGTPEQVLPKVSKLDLDIPQQEALNDLKSLLELLQESGFPFPIHLDLSLIQTFDYYTGIVFEVVSDTDSTRVLGQGGRYDQLLGIYDLQGNNYPGIGFSLNIEDVHHVLLAQDQLFYETPPSDWLVIPQTPQAYQAAFAFAQNLRSSTELVRVEVDLEKRDSPDSVREYARSRRISQIAWINADTSSTLETVN
jgi:ATP phosphoribosyltransferase regulatory subunit